MFRLLVLVALLLVGAGLWLLLERAQDRRGARREIALQELPFDTWFQRHMRPLLPEADGFDWPLNPPHAEGIAITEPFLARNDAGEAHVGENWLPPKSAEDVPVKAVAGGLVLMAMDFEPPWGGVVSIASRPGGEVWPPVVETVYAQLTSVAVEPLSYVSRGEVIGTVAPAQGGLASGVPPGLHWQVRPVIGLGLGPTYATYPTAWIEPRAFVAANRPPAVPEDEAGGKMEEAY